MSQDTAVSISASSKMHAFTFNGNTGEFTKDFSPDTSGNLPKVISPFQIICVRRQYLLEDTKRSSAPGESRWNGIYKSGYFDVKYQGRFSLYNHKGEIYGTPTGNDAFSDPEITKIAKWSDLSKHLQLNKKVVIFGVMNGKLGKITSSEGNMDEILRFIKASTSGRVDPFAEISSEKKTLSNGKTYFALKISPSNTAKIHPSAKDIGEAFSAIEAHIEEFNATVCDSAGQNLEVLIEFEERMRAYVGKTVEIVQESEKQATSVEQKPAFIEHEMDCELEITEDGFDIIAISKKTSPEEEFYSAPDVTDQILS